MTAPPEDDDLDDKLLHGVRLRASRSRTGDGEPSVARHLGKIGVLGWIVVTPMLLGVFGGRWLDGRFHSGLMWTAPLLMIGAALGCWSAWKWTNSG